MTDVNGTLLELGDLVVMAYHDNMALKLTVGLVTRQESRKHLTVTYPDHETLEERKEYGVEGKLVYQITLLQVPQPLQAFFIQLLKDF